MNDLATLSPKRLCDAPSALDGIQVSGRQYLVQHNHADRAVGLLASKAAGSVTARASIARRVTVQTLSKRRNARPDLAAG
jgi:hypothetical protein